MTASLVTTEQRGGVLIVKLNSPDTRNSLTVEIRQQLGRIVTDAEQDRAVRSIYLCGEGASFCSGGDLRMLQTAKTPWPVHRRFRQHGHWLTPLTMLDKPVVVGVQGHAVGGGMGLALAGDVIFAAESAKFVAGFFRLGAVPDIGMMYQLPRLMGMSRAKNFLFGGDTIDADEALRLGLVRKVVPDAQLHATGIAEAERLAAGPAEVMGLAKLMMNRAFESSLEQMLATEGLGQVLAMSSVEFNEGLEAALQKRPADFAGAVARDIAAGG